MGSELLILLLLDFLAGLLAVKICLRDELKEFSLTAIAKRPLAWIVLPIFVLAWPLWIAAWAIDKSRQRAANVVAKRAAEKLEIERKALLERDFELRNSIFSLIEQLSEQSDDDHDPIAVNELSMLLAERREIRSKILVRDGDTDEADATSELLVEFDRDESKLSDFVKARIQLLLDRSVLPNKATPSLRIKADTSRLSFSESRKVSSLVSYQRKRLPETWRLTISRTYKKSLRKLGPEIRARAHAAVSDLLEHPMEVRGNSVTRLRHDKSGLWRYRIGNYRLVYLPMPKQHELVLIKLETRGGVYN